MAKKNKIIKTNAMRILDQNNISYEVHEYNNQGVCIDGVEVARLLNKETKDVYKTLVLDDLNGNHYIGVIPVDKHIDLKKFARVTKSKKLEMLNPKNLLPLTGYVRGGCSPVGMKKLFPTYIQKSAKDIDTITVSAGMIGEQIELNPIELKELVKATFEDIIVEE